MSKSRSKLYTFLFIACIAGYIWLYYGFTANITELNSADVCLIKHVTNIPCPSCGSTRSVISILHGDFAKSFLINPLGFIIALIMIITPLWILLDLATKRKTLFDFYQKIERILKKPQYSIPLILLIVINWIWNITKGL